MNHLKDTKRNLEQDRAEDGGRVSIIKELADVTRRAVTLLTDSESTRREAFMILLRGAESSPTRFVVSSMFLRRAYPYLMKSPEESITYVTGIETGNVRVLDELVTFTLDVQKTAYVRGDLVSSTAALIDITNRGYKVNGTLHCHPGGGNGATHPSSIDMAHHERLERGGHKSVGIIMTRDGHFRFYTYRMPFTVEVVGEDVEPFGKNAFRLDLNFGCNKPRGDGEKETAQVETKNKEVGSDEKKRRLSTGNEQISEVARTANSGRS